MWSRTGSLLLGYITLLSLAAAEAAERPNILLCIADDWGYPHAGAYGCRWVSTPGFDRVASEGLLFTRAYTPNAKCAPSRACLLTGRNSWQLEAAANHVCYFPTKYKSFMEALAEAGYAIGHTVKGWGPGVAKNPDGSRRLLTGPAFNRLKLTPPARFISNVDYAANFADFLDRLPEGKPWCFWYGSIEPHRAYEYGVSDRLRHRNLSEIDRVPGYWPDNEVVRRDMLDYGFEVEYFDSHVVRMLEELDRRNLAENTIVLVTSDHGMPFPRCKGQCYEASNHVPLAVRWPEGIKRPGRLVNELVTFIDIAPTILECAAVSPESAGMAPMAGQSLVPLFEGQDQLRNREYILIGKERHDVGRPHDWGYPIRGIVTTRWLYLVNFEPDRWPAGNPETGYLNCDGSPTKTEVLKARKEPATRRYWQLCFGKRPREELYDILSDPDCLRNLAADSRHRPIADRLKETMFDALKREGDPRMFGRGHVFDEYPYANPAHRHFYERYMAGERLRAGWVNPSDFERTALDGAGNPISSPRPPDGAGKP